MTTHMGAIVVGVDGSEESSAALAWAVDIARDGQPLHVVHAFSPQAELALSAVQVDWMPERQHRARELDKSWVAHARERGATAYTSIVDDDPAHALTSKVAACDGSMIVVGPHGSGGHRSLGRVARELLHALPVPVVIARPPSDAASGQGTPRVLAAVGYGQAVDPALDWAVEFADAQGFDLELLHVVGHRPIAPFDSPLDMLASYFGGQTSLDWALDELTGRADVLRQRYPDLEISTMVRRGSVIKHVLERSQGAAMVVLGKSHSEGITRNVVASRTLGIATQTEASVAIIP